MNKTKVCMTLIVVLGIIVGVWIMSNTVKIVKSKNNTIAVTGLSEYNFTSDLIVWKASYSSQKVNSKEAYTELKKNQEIVMDYLRSKAIADSCITVGSINLREVYDDSYINGRMNHTFMGYNLSQSITITSHQVNEVEKVSREITELIDKGVNIQSQSPKYYYTKLAELKIKMLMEAANNALDRANVIAEGSDVKLGSLVSASSGVFQIVGQNSDEDYSWGGSYNTSSKEKTASVTVKSVFKIK